jgi:hypothetical protein
MHDDIPSHGVVVERQGVQDHLNALSLLSARLWFVFFSVTGPGYYSQGGFEVSRSPRNGDADFPRLHVYNFSRRRDSKVAYLVDSSFSILMIHMISTT